MNDYHITEPTPQDYGLPENPNPQQMQVWNRQELFLTAYSKTGKRGEAAKEVGLSVSCIENWVAKDVWGIRKRMALAHQQYVESLEQLMDERLLNPTGNRGSDVLLMFKLKAEAPEKYREEVKVLGVSAPLQMLDRLRELATRERKAQEALEAPAVEGEFKEVVSVSETKAESPSVEPPGMSRTPTRELPTGGNQSIPREVSRTAKRQVADKGKANILRKVNRR
jgi:hypothetical protein